jgi:hypothetical protein
MNFEAEQSAERARGSGGSDQKSRRCWIGTASAMLREKRVDAPKVVVIETERERADVLLQAIAAPRN